MTRLDKGGKNSYICKMKPENPPTTCEHAPIVSESQPSTAPREATLYLLPVPLSAGAPGDVMPERNIEIARRVKHFVVENMRSARRFLKRCDPSIDISTLSMTVLDEHTPPGEVPAMLAPMERGEDMAVVSEAGCPAVADPGSDIVAAAQRRGFRVCPLVGPSSILLALMGSGFNGQSFCFAGYLPANSEERTRKLREMERRIERERQTQIFIETPYRNRRMIDELCRQLPGKMLLCVASDLTGKAQRIVTQPLSRWSRTDTQYLDRIPAIFLLFNQ